MLSEPAALILAHAFAKLLGKPEPGSMAFIRCLPSEVSMALAAHARFAVPGWRVAAVVDSPDPQTRRIGADQAVEWREGKGQATLLLVDPTRAGAGMDGIYGATREIGEAELFQLATELARQQLPHGYKGFAQKAMVKAGWGTRRRPLAPWSALDYLCRACEDADQVGAALPVIGLWPVATKGAPDAADLDKSLLLAERLLPTQGSRLAPEQRAAALRLGDGEVARETALARMLRQVDPMPRHDALACIATAPDLWLNRMNPGVFDDQTLQGIEWVPWRGRTGRPAAWSGLVPTEDDRLELRLSLNPEDRTTRARLEVRWKADPDDLAKGAAEYQVEVRSGQDVLAEKTISHTGRSPQKAVFTQDDFDDLDENARFEAEVSIRALGDHPCEATSEDFVLCFGEPGATVKSSAGKVYSTLALAAAHLAPDAETFKRLARNPGSRTFFSTDKKGFIACRLDGKVGRVYCPKLIADLGRDWINREGTLGRWRLTVRADGTPLGDPQFVAVASDLGAQRLAQQSRQLAGLDGGEPGTPGHPVPP